MIIELPKQKAAFCKELSVSAMLSNGSVKWKAPSPLEKFYGIGAGKIAIHYDTDHVEGSVSAVTKLINRGGGGSFFDAAVSGTPLSITGRAVELSDSSGKPVMSNSADLVGVRTMWVCSVDTLRSATKFFGSNGYEVRVAARQADFANFVQLWTDVTGSGVTENLSPRARFPATGMVLMELEITASERRFWLNGVLQSSAVAPFPWSNFYMQSIGTGSTDVVPFLGRMGDILGVTLGGDSDQAIQVARQYLSRRYAITLP